MKVRWSRIFLGLLLLVILCGLVAWFAWGQGLGDVAQDAGLGDIVDDVRDGVEDASSGGAADGASSDEPDPSRAASGREERPDDADLKPFKVLTLQYTPYMATLALMDAQGYMEELGYDLQLVDVYDPDVDLDEEGQCAAVRSGEFQALATTLDAVRKCGPGVAVGVPVGQSAGNDAIVVKPGVETWNDVFEHAVAMTGFSVSEYMACFASHSANAPIRLALRYDDASEAVDAWINSGAEQDILSVVAWEPEASRAMAAVPGSSVILSSRDARILWDVIEFGTDQVVEDVEPFWAFTRAYYMALLDLSTMPDAGLAQILDWAGTNEGRLALLTTSDTEEYLADLENEAFATLRDAAFLMDDRQALRNRLDEAAFYWEYCGVEVPDVRTEDELILPEFVLAARDDSALLGEASSRPGREVFQVTDFTDAGAVTDTQIEQARVIFETGVDIEFLPNRTDFRDPTSANETLANAVRFLRTCQYCVLEIQGGAAYPGERVCPGCRPEDSDELAIARGRRVADELRIRFDVPEGQLRFVDEPHAPQFPDSNDEQELRQDRRTFLTGYQLSGR